MSRKPTYAEARADHEYLWRICPAGDMTGGYVDQEDLAILLKKPTAATARDLYIRQICYWFEKGTEDGGKEQVEQLLLDDWRVQEIHERYVL